TLAPAIKKVLGGVNSILENFTGDESEGIGGKIGAGLLKGIGNFLSGPGLLLGAKLLFGVFQRLTVYTADALKSLTGLNAKGAEQAQIQQQIFSILQKNPEIISQINSGQTTLKGLQESILNTIKAQTLAMQQQVTLSKSLAASLASAGVSISKTGLTSGRLQTKGKADGFIPNLFDQEEASARRMGAVNPKAQMSAGTIGGQKFIKNNKEVEIVGMGRNGDSAVIPTYGSIGDKRQKELFEKMQFLGFVPNFAGPKSKGSEGFKAVKKGQYRDIDDFLNQRYPNMSKEDIAAAKQQYQKTKTLSEQKPIAINASRVGIIAAGKQGGSTIEYPNDLQGNPLKTKFYGIQNFVPHALSGKDFKKFDEQIEKNLAPAIKNIADSIIGPAAEKTFPKDTDIMNMMKSDTSAYPQIAGRIFETVISTAINKVLLADQKKSDGDVSGNRTWDYQPSDFFGTPENTKITKAIFGDSAAAALSSRTFIDSKLSPVGAGSTNASLKRKFFNTGYFVSQIEKQKQKAKKMARGFIPNFAGIKDAMETEKRMGGNPALDFQEGIGLYVRDKDTQPNFAAVKRDHPEGMGQAIKNSQKAQEALARGFIPNFKGLRGAIGGAKSFVKKGMPDVKRLFSDELEDIGPVLKGVKDNGLAASFGLSTLSGVVDEFNKDGQSAFGMVASEALKGASTFSTISSIIPGQIGLIVGAVVGTVQAIEGVTKGLKDAPLNKIIEESKRSSESSSLKELQDISGKILKEEGEAAKRKESGAKFAEAAKKAQGGFFQEAATQFQVGIQDAMNLDPTGIITAINAIPGQLSKALAEGVLGQEGFYKAGRAAEKVLPDFVENMSFVKSALGTGRSQEAQLKRGVFTKYDVTGGGRAAEEAKSYAMNLLGGLDEGFLKDLKSGKVDTSDPLKFIEALQNYKADPSQIEALKNILFNEGAAGKENIQLLIDQTKILGIEADATQKKVKELSEKMKKDQEEKKRLEEIERKAREEAARLAQELANMSKAMISSSLAARKMAFTRKANNAAIATEAFQANLNAEQPLLTEKAMAGYNYQIQTAQTEQAFQGQMFSAGQEGITGLVEAYQQAIQNEIQNITKSAGDAGVTPDQQARIQELQSVNLSGAVGQNESVDQVNANLQKIAANLKLGDSVQNTLTSQIQTTLQDSKNKQEELIEENRKQTEVQKAQYKAALRQIELQQNLKAFGGTEGFINPESQKPLLDKFYAGLKAMTTGKEFGMEKMAARGTLQAAMATVELTGGTGSAELNEKLKGTVLPQMVDSIRQEALDLASAARATGTPEGEAMAQVYEQRATEAEKIAEDQYDNALKKNKLPDNVDAMRSMMETLTSQLSSDPLTQGFKAALDGLNLNAQFEKISQLLNINNDIAANAQKQLTLKKELSDLETGLKNQFGSVEKAQALAAGGDDSAKQELKKYEEKKQELEAMQKQEKNLETVRETKTKAEAKESRVTISKREAAEADRQGSDFEKTAVGYKLWNAKEMAELEGTFDKTYGGLEGARTAAAGGDKKAQESVALYD
ncbi:hypothetical protein EB077_08815, partial [bacterium]|nr:hypothetical protein [bacterium]